MLGLMGGLGCTRDRTAAPSVLTRVEEVRRLTADQAAEGRRVRLRAVVTYFDAEGWVAFVQDDTGGIYVLPPLGVAPLRAGQYVEVAGTSDPGEFAPIVRAPTFRVLGRAPLPPPRRVSLKYALSGREESQWIEVRGLLRSARLVDGRLHLELFDEGRRLDAVVREPDPSSLVRLVDAQVRARGVLCLRFDAAKERAQDVFLAVPSHAELAIEVIAPPDPFERPPEPIATVSRRVSGTKEPLHRVRVSGVLRDRTAEGLLLLEDTSGSAAVDAVRDPGGRRGAWLDVVGFPEAGVAPSLVIRHAVVRTGVVAPVRAVAPPSPSPAVPAAHGLLTSADQVRRLPRADAVEGRPARLRGVVTYVDPTIDTLFLQDATGGVQVNIRGARFEGGVGSLVQIDAVASYGDLVPALDQPRIALLGRTPLPVPQPMSPDDLLAGQRTGERIAVEGTVRSFQERDAGVVLVLAAGGRRFNARLPAAERSRAPELVGAHVRLSGVGVALGNAAQQANQATVYLNDLSAIEVLQPALPADRLPLRAIAELLQFRPPSDLGRRVRVRGAVTLHLPGRGLYLQDGSHSLWVEADETVALHVGDQVEVLGFCEVGEYTPQLQDAVFVPLGPGPAPAATRISAADALSGAWDARLVELEGRLLRRVADASEEALVVESQGFVYGAHLEGTADALERLEPGTLLRLTGVCSVKRRQQRLPQSFRILLRSTKDVGVVQGPSGWTLRTALWALGGASLLALTALVWGARLRQRVRYHEAVLAERRRLVGEIHDTLGQNISAVDFALSAASELLGSDNGRVRRPLDLARAAVAESQRELRRLMTEGRLASVQGDLAGALASLVARWAEPSTAVAGPRIELQVAGSPRPLAPTVATEMFLIAREAVTNALRHAGARQIALRLAYEADRISLMVQDDGCGFDAGRAVAPGRLGLESMERRAKSLGGHLSLRSAPGHGTELLVTLRAPERAARRVSA